MRILPTVAVAALIACAPGAAVVFAPSPVLAQTGCRASTPQPGTLARSLILNGLRPHVEAMAGEDVEFVVDRIRLACNWARVRAAPRAPGGRGNHYETVDALLERRGGVWRVRHVACAEADCPSAAEQYRQAVPSVPTSLLFD